MLSVQCISAEEGSRDWLCGLSACCCWQNNSVSPSDSLRAASEKHRGSSDYGLDSKKRKVDDKDNMSRYVSISFIGHICNCHINEFVAVLL